MIRRIARNFVVGVVLVGVVLECDTGGYVGERYPLGEKSFYRSLDAKLCNI